MKLVTDTALVDRYQKRFRANFVHGTLKRVRTITGMHLTERDFDIYWDEENGVWGHFDRPREQSRHWNAFGIDDPGGKRAVVNTVQINPSRVGKLDTGGAFLFDQASDTVYVAHSGKLRGQDATKVLSMFDTVSVLVRKKERKYVVIAELDDVALNAYIAEFARKCAAFKAGTPISAVRQHGPIGGDEYEGEIKYRRRGYVATRRTHGLIYKRLRQELSRLGMPNAERDVNRDLYVGGPGQSLLFEIKTDSTTSSIYSAVGQLMMHGRAHGDARCVLVSPRLKNGDGEKLTRIGIETVEYELKGETVKFFGLHQILKTKGT